MMEIRRILAKAVLTGFVFVILSFGISWGTSDTSAKQAVNILCPGEVLEELPDPFPGAYYNLLARGTLAPDYTYRFVRITEASETEFAPPFTPEQSQTLLSPRISPDERLMVFVPIDNDTPLTVWDIWTNEVATLMLNITDSEHLRADSDLMDQMRRGVYAYELFLKRLVWRDPATLVIQYFPDVYYASPLSEKVISVMVNPLRLVAHEDIEVATAVVPLTEDVAVFASPSADYQAIIEQVERVGPGHALDLNIYDARTSALVFSVSPTAQAEMVGRPIWANDGKWLFYTELNPQTRQLQIIQVDTYDGFEQVNFLRPAIEEVFGPSYVLSPIFSPVLSSSGRSIGFNVRNLEGTATDPSFMISYTPETGEITAICSPRLDYSQIVPFWTPGDRYLGYLDMRGFIRIFDMRTGRQYAMNNNEPIGWVPVNFNWSVAGQ